MDAFIIYIIKQKKVWIQEKEKNEFLVLWGYMAIE